MSDDENSENEDSDSDSAHNADSRPARKGPGNNRVTHTYVNDENIFVTFKVLGWTEEAVDMVIDHLQVRYGFVCILLFLAENFKVEKFKIFTLNVISN